MPDLYSFTFDENKILPILTRGTANTVDPFSYTGDGRIYGKPTPKVPTGGNEINTQIMNLLDGGEIDVTEIEELTNLAAKMDIYSGDQHDSNPRNILFTDKEIDEETGEIDEESPVYGHYRTTNFQKKREYKIKKFPKKNIPSAEACPSEWYAEDKGAAEPPFWQVLYGKEGEVNITNTKSLQVIVNLAIEELKKPMGTSQDKPINLFGKRGQSNWPSLIIEINTIKDILVSLLDDPNPKTGYFRHGLAMKQIKAKEHRIPTRIKFQGEIRNKLKIPEALTVNRAYFSITRGMINQAAAQILIDSGKKEGVDFSWPDKSRPDNSLKIRGVGEKKDDDTKNTSFNKPVSDWRDILKREIIC